MAQMLEPYKPKVILEIAGSVGSLARCILTACPTVEKYIFTDFCPEALAIARDQLKDFDNVEYQLFDGNHWWELPKFGEFDTLVCTCLEHLVKDIQILEMLHLNTKLVISLPNFICEGHVRCFRDRSEVFERYGSLIQIESFYVQDVTHSKRGYFARLRAWIYRNRFRWFFRKFADAFGMEIYGNKKKFNFIAIRK
jgi:hypothetical protein